MALCQISPLQTLIFEIKNMYYLAELLRRLIKGIFFLAHSLYVGLVYITNLPFGRGPRRRRCPSFSHLCVCPCNIELKIALKMANDDDAIFDHLAAELLPAN